MRPSLFVPTWHSNFHPHTEPMVVSLLRSARPVFMVSCGLILPFFALAFLASPLKSRADVLVVPSEYTNKVGSEAISLRNDSVPRRIVTVYSSGQFISVMPVGGLITEIAYRVDERHQSALDGVFYLDLIRMSASS